jgi:Domain of unknown function (DUF4010)
LPGLALIFAAGAAGSWWEARRIVPRSAEDLVIPAANPLRLTAALMFAALFLAVSLVTAWAETAFGEAGIFALAAFVGLSDIDPFVLDLAQGGAPGMPPSAGGCRSADRDIRQQHRKGAYALGVGGLRAAELPAIALGAPALLGFATAAVYLR